MILPLLFLLMASFSTPTTLSADTETPLKNPQTISAYVKEYYADTPILIDIAWCESRYRQWGTDGKIFRGAVNRQDVGVMQINADYHAVKAQSLGMDIYGLSGNLAYAQYLFDTQGTKPWASSEACWDKIAQK